MWDSDLETQIQRPEETDCGAGRRDCCAFCSCDGRQIGHSVTRMLVTWHLWLTSPRKLQLGEPFATSSIFFLFPSHYHWPCPSHYWKPALSQVPSMSPSATMASSKSRLLVSLTIPSSTEGARGRQNTRDLSLPLHGACLCVKIHTHKLNRLIWYYVNGERSHRYGHGEWLA